MIMTVAALAFSLALSPTEAGQWPAIDGSTPAEKGGKVGWKKGSPQAAMSLAKKSGAAMMLYFTSKG